MKIVSITCLGLLMIGSLSVANAGGCDSCDMKKPEVKAEAASKEWMDKAKADYPIATCVVSKESLTDDKMVPVDYVYKKEGKEDRLIRFCCKRCVKSFEKDPAKYLAVLDAAVAEKAAAAKNKVEVKTPSEKSEHTH